MPSNEKSSKKMLHEENPTKEISPKKMPYKETPPNNMPANIIPPIILGQSFYPFDDPTAEIQDKNY